MRINFLQQDSSLTSNVLKYCPPETAPKKLSIKMSINFLQQDSSLTSNVLKYCPPETAPQKVSFSTLYENWCRLVAQAAKL
ncbi:CLUMA_CG019418, isoform A [Clunio marinus]|uniref:CLUMA_CG019418, isoform A n=1 Tax=Clunio marinus TaxID=568069 RepID=A0A1J1J1K1_9DIPT|nr:CLUMA_CG019418, isoform A [Clunio marinus]